MLDFLFKNKRHNNEKIEEIEKPKLVVSSIEELEKMSNLFDETNKENNIEELLNEKYIENTKPVTVNYELPTENLITNEKMKQYMTNNSPNYINVPLGISDDEVLSEDLNKLSNILIGGTVSSGKTTFINSIISGILLTKKPTDVKLVIIDFKKVELSNYNGVPHLLMPVIFDPKKASIALEKLAYEIKLRYDTFIEKGAKNINEYNKWIDKENKVRNEEEKICHMPYILIIIDSYQPNSDELIRRITEIGNKAGVFVILSSNSCSNEVISQETKVNFPTRICFKVPSKRDSVNVLDKEGANELVGLGNYLLVNIDNIKPKKITSIMMDEEDIQNIIDYTAKQQIAQFDEKWTNLDPTQDNNNGVEVQSLDDEDDDLYNDVVEFVVSCGKASASLIQRRFKIGYNRSARLIDLLEERGIIGPQNGSKPREVLVTFNK